MCLFFVCYLLCCFLFGLWFVFSFACVCLIYLPGFDVFAVRVVMWLLLSIVV